MPLEPTQDDLDNELLEKLTTIIARQWEGNDAFMEGVKAYAAVRSIALLKEVAGHLEGIKPAIDNLNETVLCMLSELPLEERKD